MSRQVSIRHTHHYLYDRLVKLGPQEVRLHPSSYCPVPIEGYQFRVDNERARVRWYTDSLGNRVARFATPQPVDELRMSVELSVSLISTNPFDFLVDKTVESFPVEWSADQNEQRNARSSPASRLEPMASPELLPFRQTDERCDSLDGWIAAWKVPTNTVEVLTEMNRRVHDLLEYEARDEVGVQSVETTFRLRKGSCRDMAWLLIHVLRRLGFAARFVAGYLVQLASDERRHDDVDYHAWAEVYLPGAGWIGLDATSGLLAAEGHIPLAVGTTPQQAAALVGTHSDAQVTFSHTLQVYRCPVQSDERPQANFRAGLLTESPRNTPPETSSMS